MEEASTMQHLIAWAGFAGGWLLFAGPLAQAARELSEEEFEREHFEQLKREIEPPARISRWWLLLPPVFFMKQKRRDEIFRLDVTNAMSDDELVAMSHLRNVAQAWMFVAAGASLIATKETWELVETYHWSEWVFWVAVLTMFVACVGGTIDRLRRDDPSDLRNRA